MAFISNDLRPLLHLHYKDFIASTSAFQHQLSGLLFFVHIVSCETPIPFLVPIILSIRIPLGACFEPVSLKVPASFAAFAHYGFS